MARDTAYVRPDSRFAGFLRRTTQQRRYSYDVWGVLPSPTDALEAHASRCQMRGASSRTAFLGRSLAAETAIKGSDTALKKRRYRAYLRNPAAITSFTGVTAAGSAAHPILPLGTSARDPSISPARQTTPMKRSTWRRNRQAPKRRCAAPNAIGRRGETNVERLAMGAEILLAVVKPWRPAACSVHPLCEASSRIASRDGE
jgi:hypothetical protein